MHGDTAHIVSRGLWKPSTLIAIPRIFNRPELVFVDIKNSIKKRILFWECPFFVSIEFLALLSISALGGAVINLHQLFADLLYIHIFNSLASVLTQ